MLLALFAACSPDSGFDVRATLQDGQVLHGEVSTPILTLDGELGVLEIPVEDIGEIVPVEGGDLAGSNGHVTVWLRNGSELRGQWSRPELAMGLEVGGELVPVDVPVDQLQRFQTTDGEHWPDGEVFRVRTSSGDDFLVDPLQTRITIENELGTFSPFLTECVRLEPLEGPEGDWRVELYTGTVLVGPMAEDELRLTLEMGPDTITVPLAALEEIERQRWAPGQYAEPSSVLQAIGYIEGSDSLAPAEAAAPAVQGQVQVGRSSPAGWFDNSRMREAKKVK